MAYISKLFIINAGPPFKREVVHLLARKRRGESTNREKVGKTFFHTKRTLVNDRMRLNSGFLCT